jgi:hypothetical protein
VSTVAEEWVMVIRLAIDGMSPFRGLVDLDGIYDLPIETQLKVYHALTPEERARLKALYGRKEE